MFESNAFIRSVNSLTWRMCVHDMGRGGFEGLSTLNTIYQCDVVFWCLLTDLELVVLVVSV